MLFPFSCAEAGGGQLCVKFPLKIQEIFMFAIHWTASNIPVYSELATVPIIPRMAGENSSGPVCVLFKLSRVHYDQSSAIPSAYLLCVCSEKFPRG